MQEMATLVALYAAAQTELSSERKEIAMHQLEQICPICQRPVESGYPQSVEFEGQTIHAECVERAEAQANAKAKGYNPNNSYT